MRTFYTIIVPLLFFFIIFNGCERDEVIRENIVLQFSTDTVYFDTVLTTLGSVTRYFRIYNTYDQPIEIGNIGLARGDDSYFRLNLDGREGRSFNNVQIPQKDSLYMFVEVTIDPLDENNPLLIKDSIIFSASSMLQDVKLIAYGQDVHLLDGEVFETQTWTGDKPYLIVNSAALDSNEVLTIDPGAHIYLTPASSLIIWGRMEAKGTYENPIVFTGARFDGRFEESAGQWGTIFFDEKSTGNILEHVVIKNAVAGIQVGYPDEENETSVELRNCMILNSSALGVYAFNSTINAYNTIIADCGSLALYLQMGGTYNFYHCTISNISAFYPDFYQDDYKPRGLPSVFFTNYYDWFDLDDDYRIYEVTYPEDLDVNFVNSIIYGSRASEVYYDTLARAGLEYQFDHCLLKMHEDSLSIFDSTRLVSMILNQDPGFLNDSIALGDYDFQLADTSKAIDAGSLEAIEGIEQLNTDIMGNPRINNGLPDLGAYEFSN